MDSYTCHVLYPIEEEITPQDHLILQNGGTSSNIERLQSRLQQSKLPPRSLKKRVEDLAYENSYLKAELAWHTETKHALLQFREEMYTMFHRMEDALVELKNCLRNAESRYLSFWGLDVCDTNSNDMI
ncbi:unnamed protein product [Aspergillus oryzae RIB40]|uniref:DNA, SC102 n=1 Tax=Aspergillus oryzae (strain ATCC 42149 / RIB 40) TaxID=510516 RepID=Q2UAD4_ASPOR|nr:unnamed protein product [Aspergillus oryzae RIB40]BAE61481.1 unnamed protein product [Aspergillus oryzae RIB40]